jgi:hypothetical protein
VALDVPDPAVVHAHLPYRDGRAMRCDGCALAVEWAALEPPPDFGTSGMASWTNTDAPG